jgi:hypothetical protein
MARKERRAEMREIGKKLFILKTDPVLLALIKDKELSDTVQNNLMFLEQGEYVDKDIQMKYMRILNWMQTIKSLEYRLTILRGNNK